MKPAAFVHVFKTGGTSISDWISEFYEDNSVPPDPDTFSENRYYWLNTNLLRGHVYARDVIDLDRTTLTTLRAPESHLMSVLWHLASGVTIDRDHAAYRYDAELLDIAKRISSPPMFMTQSRFFCPTPKEPERAPELIPYFDSVGITENIADTLRLFAWKLNLPAPRNIPHARKSGAGKAPMPEKIREILDEKLRLDTSLYEAAATRFRNDFDELRAAAGSESEIDAYLDYRAAPKRSMTALRRYIAWKFT